jgi:hypothetical protein
MKGKQAALMASEPRIRCEEGTGTTVRAVTIEPAGGGNIPRRIAGVLSAAAVMLIATAPARNASPAELAPNGAPRVHGFALSPGTCELGPEFCAVTAPRPWAQPEIDLIRTALDEIAASDLGSRISQRAGQNGFRTLRRFAQAAQLNAQERYDAQPMIDATTHTDDHHSMRTIDVTDRFFARGSARDHFSGEPGYMLTTEILAHELVHAMDLDQQYSRTAEFRRVARLGTTAAQQQEADRVNLERARLNAEGRYEAGWEASRSFALLRLRGRLPSVQALDSYREAFAEFGAHLILDSNARRRFEPRLIRYFDGAVGATGRPDIAAGATRNDRGGQR